MSVVSHVQSLGDYFERHQSALKDPAGFWLKYAERYFWKEKPSREKALSYNFDVREGPIFVKWFADGETNICFNALDRQVDNGNGSKVAFFWEGNDPNDTCSMTYVDLLVQVSGSFFCYRISSCI